MLGFSILGIFERFDFFHHCPPEELAEALCREELGRMEDCVLKKVGKPCQRFVIVIVVIVILLKKVGQSCQKFAIVIVVIAILLKKMGQPCQKFVIHIVVIVILLKKAGQPCQRFHC